MVPGWLRPWWNFWAEFFDLFDWNAIGAVATAAALIFAYVELRKARGADRITQAKQLEKLRMLVQRCWFLISDYGTDMEEGHFDRWKADLVSLYGEFGQLSALDFPDGAPRRAFNDAHVAITKAHHGLLADVREREDLDATLTQHIGDLSSEIRRLSS